MESYTVVSIICPECGATLEPNDDVCRQCGANTSSATGEDEATTGGIKHSRLLNKPWLLVVIVLHVGVLGIPLYWSTKYSTNVRLAIIGASIVYTVIAVSGIAWGCLQILEAFRMFAR